MRGRLAARRAQGVPVVVDASTAVQWFANEPGSERAARLIESGDALLAPDIMAVEAASAWWKKVRRAEMEAADLADAVVHLFALGIGWVPAEALLTRAAQMALEIDHPVYDCLYLALSSSRGTRLATADDRLRGAAVRLGIPIWAP
ncbi:MAG: type II toxin-antitoxin system VapC family toxin [Candidatus Rokubacteria bacterium]|nr:type II toxin-antitoxin system VapC family toxin [Candidatus Rokubacteria bacterium]